jgi:hypothetical protein
MFLAVLHLPCGEQDLPKYRWRSKNLRLVLIQEVLIVIGTVDLAIFAQV